ncbi:MAG: hypothetical protein AMXMBFR84_43050 [Candidatus Hydrogenedentota bacterium]
MKESVEYRTIYGCFATLLTYPEQDIYKIAPALEKRLASLSPPAAEELWRFVQFLEAATLAKARELYTRAFDLSPLAVPYLSVYLFGAENPQRGQFMAGFSGAYAESGYDSGGELPDHLAVVLGYAAVASEDTWDEVQRFCLPLPLRLMCQSLREGETPYHHVLASLQHFVKHVTAGALIHA